MFLSLQYQNRPDYSVFSLPLSSAFTSQFHTPPSSPWIVRPNKRKTKNFILCSASATSLPPKQPHGEFKKWFCFESLSILFFFILKLSLNGEYEKGFSKRAFSWWCSMFNSANNNFHRRISYYLLIIIIMMMVVMWDILTQKYASSVKQKAHCNISLLQIFARESQ